MKEQALYSQELEGIRNRGTILLVEDESSLREVICQVLSGAGYNVLCSANAMEAAALYCQNRDQVQLLLTDMVMPGKNGRQLAREIRQMCPDLKVIFTTGYPQDDFIEGEQETFLPKPFSVHALLSKIRQMLEHGSDNGASNLKVHLAHCG